VHLDAPFMHVNRRFALIAISQPNARAADVMNDVKAGVVPAALWIGSYVFHVP
jgi:hypothetical protein